MQFTFGIITDWSTDSKVNEVIESIRKQKMDTYEVIVVGGVGQEEGYNIHNYETGGDHTYRFLPFWDEANAPGWITKKKNIITQRASYDNIVYLHDYIKLCDGWYEGFKKFGDDWDIAMNVVLNADDTRFRDWCAWDDPQFGQPWTCHEPWCPSGHTFKGQPRLVPYDYDRTQFMYISGAYWVAKRHVMEAEPLNERLKHCQAEDVEWSLRVREKYRYRMNTLSCVQSLRQKDLVLQQA